LAPLGHERLFEFILRTDSLDSGWPEQSPNGHLPEFACLRTDVRELNHIPTAANDELKVSENGLSHPNLGAMGISQQKSIPSWLISEKEAG